VAIARVTQAVLSRPRARGPFTGAVLLLHGGKVKSVEPVRRTNLALARMRPFAAEIDRRAGRRGVAAFLLRDRLQGWNGADADPVVDARWALEHIEQRYGPIPVVLLGHSMGGRAALRAAGHPRVAGVVALAPWVPEGEPVGQLHDRSVLIAHGSADRVTEPELSLSFAQRAREDGAEVEYRVIPRGDHAMLRSAREWHALAAEFAVRCLPARPADGENSADEDHEASLS
jgi:dienelactone hydrolase